MLAMDFLLTIDSESNGINVISAFTLRFGTILVLIFLGKRRE